MQQLARERQLLTVLSPEHALQANDVTSLSSSRQKAARQAGALQAAGFIYHVSGSNKC